MSKKQVLSPITAYGFAVQSGFQGTVEEWLESLHAHIGENGNWFVGDEDTGVLADPAQLQKLTNDAIDSADRAEAAAEKLTGTIADVAQMKTDISLLDDEVKSYMLSVEGGMLCVKFEEV